FAQEELGRAPAPVYRSTSGRSPVAAPHRAARGGAQDGDRGAREARARGRAAALELPGKSGDPAAEDLPRGSRGECRLAAGESRGTRGAFQPVTRGRPHAARARGRVLAAQPRLRDPEAAIREPRGST